MIRKEHSITPNFSFSCTIACEITSDSNTEIHGTTTFCTVIVEIAVYSMRIPCLIIASHCTTVRCMVIIESTVYSITIFSPNCTPIPIVISITVYKSYVVENYFRRKNDMKNTCFITAVYSMTIAVNGYITINGNSIYKLIILVTIGIITIQIYFLIIIAVDYIIQLRKRLSVFTQDISLRIRTKHVMRHIFYTYNIICGVICCAYSSSSK